MKTISPGAFVRRLTGVAGSLTAIALTGCDVTGPSTARFIIHVDSIEAPSTILTGTALEMRFHGPIGPNGCWQLARVDKQVTSASFDVTFYGEHRERSGSVCSAAPVALIYEAVLAAPLDSPFTITVHQPDGSLMRHVVTVQ